MCEALLQPKYAGENTSKIWPTANSPDHYVDGKPNYFTTIRRRTAKEGIYRSATELQLSSFNQAVSQCRVAYHLK